LKLIEDWKVFTEGFFKGLPVKEKKLRGKKQNGKGESFPIEGKIQSVED